MNTLVALAVITIAGSVASAQSPPISLRTDFRCGTPSAPINLIAGRVNTVRFTFTTSDHIDAAMIDSNDRVYNRVPLTLRQVEAAMPAHMLQAPIELRTGTIAHPLTGIPTTQYVEMDIVPAQPTGSGHDLLVGRYAVLVGDARLVSAAEQEARAQVMQVREQQERRRSWWWPQGWWGARPADADSMAASDDAIEDVSAMVDYQQLMTAFRCEQSYFRVLRRSARHRGQSAV